MDIPQTSGALSAAPRKALPVEPDAYDLAWLPCQAHSHINRSCGMARRHAARPARFAKAKQPLLAQMLAMVECDGLIERWPDPGDRRSQRITLGPFSRPRHPSGYATVLKGREDALAGLSAWSVRGFIDYPTRVIANLDRLIKSVEERACETAESSTCSELC